MTFQPTRPASYTGVRAPTPINLWTRNRDPNAQDLRLYVIGDLWYNKATVKFWILIDTGSFGALWVPLNTSATQSILTINGVGPTALGDFSILAGANITVTPAVNGVTIAASGTGNVTWNLIGVNTLAAVNNGYVASAGAPITVTLPSVFAFGDEIWVKDSNGGGVSVVPGAGDTIAFNDQAIITSMSTFGITSAVHLLGVAANSRWDVISTQGIWNTP